MITSNRLALVCLLIRRCAGCLGILLLALTSVATAQLSVPDAHAGTAIGQPTTSILLNSDERAALQNWWHNPAPGYQSINRGDVISRANQSVSTSVPTSLSQATTQGSIIQAKALRWLATGNGNTNSADFLAVKNVLTNYAHVSGGSSLTNPLVGMNYFTAFDFINGGLTASERNAIKSRLDTNVLANLKTATRVSNHFFINHGARGFYALLSGNESNLDSAVNGLRRGYDAVTTNDGFFTDGDRYFNYTLGSMPAFLNAYKNASNDPTGIAQYRNAAEQHARYALGIRMPNGMSPTFHNSDNMPMGIQMMSRMIDDPKLKSATAWYAEQMGNFQWNGGTNALNNDWTRTDLVWSTDYSAGIQAPDWSPTYFSGGQAKISVFRNDWGTNSNYLATIAGIDGNSVPVSFGHHDTGAITLAANGAQILVEPGYARYNGIIFGIGADPAMPNTPAHSNSGPNLDTKPAIEHNVFLARNTGTSDWGIGVGAAQPLEAPNIRIGNRLDSAERGGFKGVADLSTLRSNYTGTGAGGGVQTRRTTGMINETGGDDGYFIMADSFRSSDGINKDFAVNLIGKSKPVNTEIMADTANYKKIRWSVDDYFGVTNNGAQRSGHPYDAPTSGQVIAHIVSTDPMENVSHDTSWSIDNWGIFIQTQRMRIGVMDTDMGAVLTFFETGPADFVSEWSVTPMSAETYAAARIDSTDGWSDWHMSQTSATDVHSIFAGDNVSIDGGALASDAQYAYLRRVGEEIDSAMIAHGTKLFSSGQPIFEFDHAVTASFLLSDVQQGEIHATLSMDDYVDQTMLTLFGLPGRIDRVKYDGMWITSFTDATVTLPLIAGMTSVALEIYTVPEPSRQMILLGGVLLCVSIRRRNR